MFSGLRIHLKMIKFCPRAEEVRLQSVHFIVYDFGYTGV